MFQPKIENGLFKRRSVDGLVACAEDGEGEADAGDLDVKGGLEEALTPQLWASADDDDNFDATISASQSAGQDGSDSDLGGSKAGPDRIFVRSGAPPPLSSSST